MYAATPLNNNERQWDDLHGPPILNEVENVAFKVPKNDERDSHSSQLPVNLDDAGAFSRALPFFDSPKNMPFGSESEEMMDSEDPSPFQAREILVLLKDLLVLFLYEFGRQLGEWTIDQGVWLVAPTVVTYLFVDPILYVVKGFFSLLFRFVERLPPLFSFRFFKDIFSVFSFLLNFIRSIFFFLLKAARFILSFPITIGRYVFSFLLSTARFIGYALAPILRIPRFLLSIVSYFISGIFNISFWTLNLIFQTIGTILNSFAIHLFLRFLWRISLASFIWTSMENDGAWWQVVGGLVVICLNDAPIDGRWILLALSGFVYYFSS